MTFSILAHDAETGRYGGAAATGSLCVGGWVLRGRPDAGLSASQGTAPSTLWGEAVLDGMAGGLGAAGAVAQVTGPDTGRAHRQLAALDPEGGTAAFTGAASVAACGHRARGPVIVAGNMLADAAVLDAALAGFYGTEGPLDARLLAALRAGERAGSDSRGLLSAALLVVARDRPPLSLRIDHDPAPLDALEALHATATSGAYAGWTRLVPTCADPWRAPATGELDGLGPAAGAEDPAPLPDPGT